MLRLPRIDECSTPVSALSPGDHGIDFDGQVYRLVGPVPGREEDAAVLVLMGARSGGRPVEVEAEWGHKVRPLTVAEASAVMVRKQR